MIKLDARHRRDFQGELTSVHIIAFDPADYRDAFERQGWVHTPGRITPEFEAVRRLIAGSVDDARIASRSMPGRGRALIGRLFVLVAIVATLAALAAPAGAVGFVHGISQKVALVPGNRPVPSQGPNGVMPISAHVTGRPAESFDRFSFNDLALNQITSASLSQYDTVALIQVTTSSLTVAAKDALAQFVANGGKLIIHDSDETSLNDYSWLSGGPYLTKVGAGCNNCGSTAGFAKITNSSLISANPADPSYVSLAELGKFTDAIGDANLLVSTDPRWLALAQGTNGRNESGAVVAYANSNNGLIIYNGFDTDYIKALPTDPWRCNSDRAHDYKCLSGTPSVDWLAQMWYSELTQGWGTPAGSPSGGGGGAGGGGAGGGGAGGGAGGGGVGGGGLPHKPVIAIGTPLAAFLAGLPSNRGCVAHRVLLLRLRSLAHLHHRRVVQVDVYVNLRHVKSERQRFAKLMLKHLPRHGNYTVTVIATTERGYHLIAQRRYHGC